MVHKDHSAEFTHGKMVEKGGVPAPWDISAPFKARGHFSRREIQGKLCQHSRGRRHSSTKEVQGTYNTTAALKHTGVRWSPGKIPALVQRDPVVRVTVLSYDTAEELPTDN